MQNINLAFPNRIDSSSLSGGSWLSTLPLNNIKNKRLSKLARSVGTTEANTKFTISFTQAREIDLVALIAHNMSADASVRISANSSSSFASPAYQSAWIQVYPSGFLPQEQLEWEDDNFWLGTLSEEAVAGYITPFSYIIPGNNAYQYWQIEISDTGNLDGYISLGRVFIGQSFIPTFNFSWGSTLVVNDATTFETSLTGEEFFDLRQKYRVYTFTLDLLNKEEAYSTVLDMQRLIGTSGEVFCIADPDDTENFPRRNFLARLQNISPIVQKNNKWFSSQFQLKEVL